MKTLLMKTSTLLSLLFSATTLVAACSDSTKETPQPPTPEPLYSEQVAVAELPDYMVKRADAHRAILATDGMQNGVYVYSKTATTYASAPQRLAARIALLGFSDVYLSIQKSKVEAADPWIRTFISTFRRYGGRTWLIRLSSTDLLFDHSKVSTEVAIMKDYNAQVAAEERFVGISADLEPHTQKDKTKEFYWSSDTNYGIGGDNDELLKRTHTCLTMAKEALGSDRLNEAIFYNYQIYNDSGDLSQGDVKKFLASCEQVIIMAYRNSMEKIWEKSKPTLKAAEGNPKTVSIAVKTALNGLSDESSSIGQKGWDYLLETLDYLHDEGIHYDSFRGLDQFTYEGLEKLWVIQ